MFKRTMLRVTKFTEVIIVLILTTLSVVVFAQVLLRYVFGTALFLADELSRYLLVWLGFLGASLGVRAGAHIGVEILWQRLPQRAQRAVGLLASALIFVFLAALTVVGAQLLPDQLSQLSPGLGISMFWPYLAIPVGGFFMILQMADITYRLWNGQERPVYLGESPEASPTQG